MEGGSSREQDLFSLENVLFFPFFFFFFSCICTQELLCFHFHLEGTIFNWKLYVVALWNSIKVGDNEQLQHLLMINRTLWRSPFITWRDLCVEIHYMPMLAQPQSFQGLSHFQRRVYWTVLDWAGTGTVRISALSFTLEALSINSSALLRWSCRLSVRAGVDIG